MLKSTGSFFSKACFLASQSGQRPDRNFEGIGTRPASGAAKRIKKNPIPSGPLLSCQYPHKFLTSANACGYNSPHPVPSQTTSLNWKTCLRMEIQYLLHGCCPFKVYPNTVSIPKLLRLTNIEASLRAPKIWCSNWSQEAEKISASEPQIGWMWCFDRL